MSFILDALKKSETDRQRQSGPALYEVRIAPPKSRLPLWAIALCALLAVNALIVGWMLFRHSTSPASVRVADDSAPPQAATGTSAGNPAYPGSPVNAYPPAYTAPPATAPGYGQMSNGGAPAQGLRQGVGPGYGNPAYAEGGYANGRNENGAFGNGSSGNGQLANGPAGNERRESRDDGGDGSAEFNAGSARAGGAPASDRSGSREDPTLGAAARDSRSGAPGSNSDDDAPATEAAPGLGGHIRRGTESGYMLYQDAAAAPNASLPQLRLDLHVYDPQPANRFAMINMHKLREGETLPGTGAKVEQIVPDGVVMSYNGSRFLLPRD